MGDSMDTAPIIFCHYGNTDYLPYVVDCVRHTNPKKKIILLGDETNRWLSGKVEHHRFDDYAIGPEIETFNQVYQLIQGAEHGHVKGDRDWVNFVFKRWFYVYNFLTSGKIERFWHFDSDTMIVDDLAVHEAKFAAYDCTEQCDGSCMNGFISSRAVVGKYVQKINELFQRRAYLEEQAREFKTTNPGYAFTEMRAYAQFRTEEKINSIRLSQVIDGSTFDDTLVLAHGMETERLDSGKYIKKVFLHSDGRFFCREKNSGQPVQINTINLSWMPFRTYKIIGRHVSRQRSGTERKIAPAALRGPTLHSRIDSPVARLARLLKSIVRKARPKTR